MNNLLIVLLAVCLVSVHGFVKRDAPQTDLSLEGIKKNGEDLLKMINDNVNSDKIKKDFNDLVDKISTMVGEFKPKEETPK